MMRILTASLALLVTVFGFSCLSQGAPSPGRPVESRESQAMRPQTQAPPAVDVRVLDPNNFSIPPIERVASGKYTLGEIEVNKNDRTISFPAELNMERGLLEYLVVSNTGKRHESLLRTKVHPFNLQLACLLLGMEGTAAPLKFQGSAEVPTGDRVEISVQTGDGRRILAEKWVSRAEGETKSDAQGLKWVFTGSKVGNGRFAAQMTGSIVAIYRDPAAMFDNASAGGEVNGGWCVKERATPPVGTQVTVVLKWLGRE